MCIKNYVYIYNIYICICIHNIRLTSQMVSSYLHDVVVVIEYYADVYHCGMWILTAELLDLVHHDCGNNMWWNLPYASTQSRNCKRSHSFGVRLPECIAHQCSERLK